VPPPAQPAARPPDQAPPAVVVSAPRRIALVRLARSGVSVRVGCSERCRVRVELLVDARTARRARLPRTTLGATSARLPAAGATVVRVRLSPVARRRVARLPRRATLILRVTAADAAGNERVRRSRVTGWR
jgi:hypothetical protein